MSRDGGLSKKGFGRAPERRMTVMAGLSKNGFGRPPFFS